MPRLDLYHDTVKRALEKDGWRVTDDPYKIEYKDLRVFADLGAEKVIAAERAEEKIVVEIKVFGSLSMVNDLEKALGQYNLYRSLIGLTQAERDLFLAVTVEVYEEFFCVFRFRQSSQINRSSYWFLSLIKRRLLNG